MTLLRMAVLVSLMALSLGGFAIEKPAPDFKDYPVNTVYTGKTAKVILDTPEAKGFRTRLRYAANLSADFAGEYVLAVIGCGADCVFSAAVSRKTGRVVFLPGTVCCWYGEEDDKLQYRLNSRLLIASGNINEGQYGRFYYVFDGRKFTLVRKVLIDKAPHLQRAGEKMRKGMEEAAVYLESEKQQSK